MKLVDIIILLIIAILFIGALIIISKRKGKCAYCERAKHCPFKNH